MRAIIDAGWRGRDIDLTVETVRFDETVVLDEWKSICARGSLAVQGLIIAFGHPWTGPREPISTRPTCEVSPPYPILASVGKSHINHWHDVLLGSSEHK